jgi:uncharacterized membrane protein YkoI
MNKRFIGIFAILLILGLGMIGYKIFDNKNHVVINDKFYYISIVDMEEAYSIEGTYARYFIADFNEDYTIGTIEKYIEEQMNDKENIYIVSGIFVTKNAEDTVYEIAVIHEDSTSDVDIEYLILDTKTASVYSLHDEDLIFKDENMESKLKDLEFLYEALQDKNMDDYREHKIISEKYLERIVLDKLNCEHHNYIGLVEHDGVIYHKVTVTYENGKTETILVNARSGEIFYNNVNE